MTMFHVIQWQLRKKWFFKTQDFSKFSLVWEIKIQIHNYRLVKTYYLGEKD